MNAEVYYEMMEQINQLEAEVAAKEEELQDMEHRTEEALGILQDVLEGLLGCIEFMEGKE